mgnify:CR=1 FL=1
MQGHIKKYLEHSEHNRNFYLQTLRAYRNDLDQYLSFLVGEGCPDLESVTRLLLRSFLAYLKKQDYSKTTIARKLVAIRSLYKFLCREGILKSNPAENLRAPKLGKNLPGFMSVKQTETLIDLPALNTVSGIRDRAILETLYSTGMRVSELVGTDIDDIDFFNEVVKVKGKGKKERLF